MEPDAISDCMGRQRDSDLPCHQADSKKPRLFKGAASRQGGSHHRDAQKGNAGAIRLAEAG
jgi:hypothetical protein